MVMKLPGRQPRINGMARGNLVISASLIFSGNTYQRIKEFMDIAKIPFFSRTTFYDIQKKFLFPAIHRVYTINRQLLFEEIKEYKELHLIGDGRCDSPGYSAKYGTYTVMSNSGYIIDFHVSHVKVAGNSARMELHGLTNVLNRLVKNNINVTSLTTDRHIQVRSYMQKEKSDINHQFDVWHVGKNIKKKLTKCGKLRGCGELNQWIKAVINHFWWCCASCKGNADELREKWVSILYHITDTHQWEDCTIFKKCEHKMLTKEQRITKPFLKPDSPALLALEKVVKNKALLSDLKYLRNFNHTGSLEVYHSLYNKYCPKSLHFSYEGMIARSQLAVLDFNSGVGLGQAETSQGKLQYKQQFSRVTQTWVVKKITGKKNRLYCK